MLYMARRKKAVGKMILSDTSNKRQPDMGCDGAHPCVIRESD